MKRVVALLVVCGLAGIAGCGEGAATTTVSETAAPNPVALPDAGAQGQSVLVSLKVPNMTCPICAESVRTDLESIEGVTDIQTDAEKQTCSFRLTRPVDYRAKLDELSKKNDLIADYSVL